jgi:hypothetical protein
VVSSSCAAAGARLHRVPLGRRGGRSTLRVGQPVVEPCLALQLEPGPDGGQVLAEPGQRALEPCVLGARPQALLVGGGERRLVDRAGRPSRSRTAGCSVGGARAAAARSSVGRALAAVLGEVVAHALRRVVSGSGAAGGGPVGGHRPPSVGRQLRGGRRRLGPGQRGAQPPGGAVADLVEARLQQVRVTVVARPPEVRVASRLASLVGHGDHGCERAALERGVEPPRSPVTSARRRRRSSSSSRAPAGSVDAEVGAAAR